MHKAARRFPFAGPAPIGLYVLATLCLLPFRLAAAPDTARFFRLLDEGDSVYRQKAGLRSFEQSLRYFDSAEIIAEQSGEKRLLAAATFARGRVYDAWNREPATTIALFKKATALFKESGNEVQYFYALHLVAHAYDKIQDSTQATAVLRQMSGELALKDTGLRHQRLPFISEMALIASEVRAYSLADSILRQLTRRSWIVNDPYTYNYLDHYYLTQSRLDVHWRKKKVTPFLDSFVTAYARLSNLPDSVYYSGELSSLYGALGDFAKGYHYLNQHDSLVSRLHSGDELEKLQNTVAASELAAERRKLHYENALSRSRRNALLGLGLLLTIITVLSIYLYRRNRRYRAQSHSLSRVNQELDRHIKEVEILNKEIQHRIKNNLYTIYSLLHMQQDSTDNEEVIAHLEAARMRVESVAALHDYLLAGSDTVDFGAYLKTLIQKVVTCYAERRNIITHISTEPVSLPLNTSFALSLILNEWITNSIKYAAPGSDVLNMTVRIANDGQDVCIDYADDGEVDVRKQASAGLGTEIIRLLTAQIKGRLTTAVAHPYHYNLCIPNG